MSRPHKPARNVTALQTPEVFSPNDTCGSVVLFARSLSDNAICGVDSRGRFFYTAEGITALCEGLKGSAVTSLT